jgi:multimeric flavodoxin WrbA
MKVAAFNGSPRPTGNTSILLKAVLEELEKEGIETELVQVGNTKIQGCIACYKCFENKDRRCAVDTDTFNDYLFKMETADGILLGSPTYFSDVTAWMKALIERAGLVARANDYMFKGKVGAAVTAVRRAGGIPAFNTMNLLFLYGQMVVPGSTYWNVGIGRNPGDVEKDEEGIQTMRNLGRNMAWLLKKLNR